MKRSSAITALYVTIGTFGLLAIITSFGFLFNLGIALLAHGFGMTDAGRYMMTPDKALAYFGIILVSGVIAVVLAVWANIIER